MDGSSDQVAFGRFRVDVSGHALFRDGERLPLTRKAFATLVALLDDAGRTVSKQSLMDRVWPDAVVGEATLAQNVYTLRQLLKTGGSGRAIETEPGVGYRFAAEVRATGDEPNVAADVDTVAVLPFRALGDGDADRHLGVCLADALITRLSRLPDVVVRPSSAIFPYVDREVDATEVGRELRVDAVLTGTLHATDGRVRANVQLVDVRANAPLWAERFEVPFDDLFAAEDEISRQVVATIAKPLSGETALPSQPRLDEEAYRAYVRGRVFWNQRTGAALDRALDCFRYALTIDPHYAEAHAGLADCHALYPIFADIPPHEAFPRAREAAERGCALASDSAAPHASLAYTRFLYDWAFDDAEAEFRRALELDPRYATAHHWLATFLAARDRDDEAVTAIERALELDPTSRIIAADSALIHYFGGRADLAVERCERALERNPDFSYGHFVLGLALGETGDLEGSVSAAERAVATSPSNTLAHSLLGNRLGAAGRRDDALGIVKKLATRARAGYVPAAREALVWTGIGDADRAIEAWRRACDERSRFAVFLPVWPLGAIRDDARFLELVESIGSRGPARAATSLDVSRNDPHA